MVYGKDNDEYNTPESRKADREIVPKTKQETKFKKRSRRLLRNNEFVHNHLTSLEALVKNSRVNRRKKKKITNISKRKNRGK